MSNMIYRGVAYTTQTDAPKSLAEQMKKPQLVYRGIAHDGERAIPIATSRKDDQFYRGFKLA
ncbi:MAG: hypothetical protein AAF216_00420 [Pseudomonadota bacterium]